MSIPAVYAAPLLAVLLAGVMFVATPALLRRLPIPPDEEDVAPFVELATPEFRGWAFSCTAIAGGTAFLTLPMAHWPAWLALVSLGSLLGLIDLRTGFLPLRLNYLTLALAVAGAAVSAWLLADVRVLAWSLGGGAVATAFFWVVWRLGNGLGFGDVRLAALLGVVAGTQGPGFLMWTFLLGTATGAVWGLALRLRRKADGPFPYGPALLIGPLLALVISRLVQPG